jgi:hypothetical protein
MVDILKVAGLFAPAISKTAAGIWARNHLSQHLPLNISTVVSNVTGPDFPLYCAGARMVDYYGLGLLTPGMGLFHTVFSYSGKVTLSILADRDIMTDPEFYHDCLIAAYEELYRAAIPDAPIARKKPAKRSKSSATKTSATSAKQKSSNKASKKPAKQPTKSTGKSKSGARTRPKARVRRA